MGDGAGTGFPYGGHKDRRNPMADGRTDEDGENMPGVIETGTKGLRLAALGAAISLLLAGCGGGGGGESSTVSGSSGTLSVSGGGVKGPMANATVTVYAFDASRPGFRGGVVATASTDAAAAITGLRLPFPLNPPYIMEFTANGGTTDITTGKAPVITTLRTVITQSMLDKGEQIYATPLTTMAVDLAMANADRNTPVTTGGVTTWPGDNNGTTTAAEFEAALPLAATQVASTVGFGIDSKVDIFDTPPLLDSTTGSLAEQAKVAAYRTAVEALTAVTFEMSQQAAGDPDTVLAELAGDLADGAIDGTVAGQPSSVFTSTTLDVLKQDPSTLPIPNATDASGNPITVGEVERKVLATETATTGATTDTTALTDGTIDTTPAMASTDPDRDGDGVPNAEDAFPDDAAAVLDTDGDGLPDTVDPNANSATSLTADTDDDNDGVPDGADAFPLDDSEQLDTDSDTIGNNADPDDDGDGVPDVDDAFPLDPNATSFDDPDGDGWPLGQDSDNADATVPATPFVDSDGDGLADSGGLNPDADDDNDGVPDGSDTFPLDASEQLDTDGDSIGNNADADDDGDGVPDVVDAFPLDGTESRDRDGDGIGDNSDPDADGDGVGNVTEGSGNNPATDTDGDGTPDWLDLDSDNDGIPDATDANRTTVNVPNTAPVVNGTSITIDEDTPASVSVTAADAEGNPTTFRLATQPSNGTAVVNGNGTLTYTPDPDYSGSDSFAVVANDGSADSNVATVGVTVTPVNDAPVITTAGGAVSVDENTTAVLTLTATDVENDTLTWSIASGTDAAAFSIDSASGALIFASAPNFEAPLDADGNNVYQVDVVANDGTDNSAPFSLTVTVVDVIESATLNFGNPASVSFAENGTGTVSTVNVSGGIGSVSYAFAGGADDSAFTLDTATGALTFNLAPDFESPTDANGDNVYEVRVTATDSDGNSATQNLGVTVANVAEPATLSFTNGTSASVAENSTGTVLTVNATGGNGTTTYALSGTDANAFTLDAANGALAFVSPPNFEGPTDAGGDNVYNITVTATDGDGNSASQALTITVTNVTETVALNFTSPTAAAIPENTTAVATVSVDNGIGTVTYGFGGGADDTAFVLDPATGELRFATAPDFENPTDVGGDNVYNITVIASDSDGNTNSQAIAVTVTDVVNEAPGPAVWGSFNWDDGSTWQ